MKTPRDFPIVMRNMENLKTKEEKVLRVSQKWTQTMNRLNKAKEVRKTDCELYSSLMQIKLHRNLIMKHNVILLAADQYQERAPLIPEECVCILLEDIDGYEEAFGGST